MMNDQSIYRSREEVRSDVPMLTFRHLIFYCANTQQQRYVRIHSFSESAISHRKCRACCSCNFQSALSSRAIFLSHTFSQLLPEPDHGRNQD